jgi:D-arabinose 1-dehydrogenase-like Zn-dependent alcohol dehydrogenase
MKAVEIRQTGGPDVTQVRELSIPEPQLRQVLIRVAASGVNFIDLYVREGRYGNQTPFRPGQEAAGTIVAIGPGVVDLTVGQRVAWCSILGTYADYAVAPAERVVPIPANVTFEQAGRRVAARHDSALPVAISVSSPVWRGSIGACWGGRDWALADTDGKDMRGSCADYRVYREQGSAVT